MDDEFYEDDLEEFERNQLALDRDAEEAEEAADDDAEDE